MRLMDMGRLESLNISVVYVSSKAIYSGTHIFNKKTSI
jgi:hypothetical protein